MSMRGHLNNSKCDNKWFRSTKFNRLMCVELKFQQKISWLFVVARGFCSLAGVTERLQWGVYASLKANIDTKRNK